MSRELMSLPIVKPTSAPDELMTSVSSGSGTFHRASRRIPTALSGRHDFLGNRFEEDFRAGCLVDVVVGARAEVRLLHARLLAAQIGHASGPDFLGFHWCQQPHLIDRPLGTCGLPHACELSGKIRALEQVVEPTHACARQVADGTTLDQPDADIGMRCRDEAAQRDRLNRHFV